MSATIIDQGRLARITTLYKGSHNPPNGEFAACVMEAASYVAGERWSDHPACACPVITAFMVSWNDGVPDDETRTRLLLPLIHRIVGTRGSKKLANRRATMVADWLVRVHTPAWLRLAGLTDEADALANLPDFAKIPSIMGPLNAARGAAEKKWDAAKAAAWDAAGDAAWDAARDAAGAATWAATGGAAKAAARATAWDAAKAAAKAAWDAAVATAWDAAVATAWDAAGGAARATAWDALRPTTDTLQKSALDLVERMCALTEADL
jgi:hypothetical protein